MSVIVAINEMIPFSTYPFNSSIPLIPALGYVSLILITRLVLKSSALIVVAFPIF